MNILSRPKAVLTRAADCASRLVFPACSLIFAAAFFVQKAKASPDLTVAINEIAWMGAKVEGIEQKNWWRYEWLELYNNSKTQISLEGWKIEFYRGGLDWTLNLKGFIDGNDYFLIVSSDKIFQNYDLNYSNLGGKLNNGGQKITLKDGSGKIIDEIDCYNGWFAGNNETKQTMERKESAVQGSILSNWLSSQKEGGTPGVQNGASANFTQEEQPIPTETATSAVTEVQNQILPEITKQADSEKNNYPEGIIISEILPSPSGPDEEEEWIEIFNANNVPIDLSNWRISDARGKTKTFSFPEGTRINPERFLVLNRQSSGISLNNDRDGLSLFWPDGVLIDSVSYEKAPVGKSLNRTDSGWLWSEKPTPALLNIIKNSSQEKQVQQQEETGGQNAPLQKGPEKNNFLAQASLFSVAKNFIPAVTIALLSAFAILLLKKKLKVDLRQKME